MSKKNTWMLNDLVNPKKYKGELNFDKYKLNFLKSSYESMLLIRKVEEKIALEREKGTIGGPVHLGAGQEAIAVCVSRNLTSKDKIFGAHRSHAHILAMDPCIYELFAEVLGKDTGLSKGMGGSMHLINQKIGFFGSVPIVAGTVPIAVGSSFSYLKKNNKNISAVYLGDGAMEEGVVHESLNLSKILNCPTLFVIENNLFSSHMHISLRQPKFSTSRFAEANNIEYKIVDGNNIIEVFESSKYLIEKIREGDGPKFLEAVTHRHYGHVDWRKDVDVGVNRSEQDLNDWNDRDPISRLEKTLLKNFKNFKLKNISNLEKKIDQEINNAWEKALKDPYPKKSELLKRVYFKP